ncbi:MAG: signal peptidase I [Actinomycetota bacterium]
MDEIPESDAPRPLVTGSEPTLQPARSLPPPPPAPPPSRFTQPAKKSSGGNFWKELPLLLVIAFGLALLIKTFLLQAFFIPSGSMEPTLQINDRVLVNKLVYRIHPPRRGDIIVFIEQPAPHKPFWSRVRSFFTEGLGVTKPASRDFIKRVIGLPGETIQIKSGVVTITPSGGRSFQLSEPYLNTERDLSSYGPFTIPADTYFVMGDHRADSADSRTSLGPIRKSVIVGRAFIRIWPPGRVGFFHRPRYETGGKTAAAVAPVLVLGAAVVRHRRIAA